MKKLISLAMAVIMLMTAMTTVVTAYAAENGDIAVSAPTSGTSGNISWKITGNTLTITGNGDMLNYDPHSVPWYDSKSNIKNIVIADTVTSIGDNAFRYFSNMTSLNMGNGIKKIGKEAIYNCDSLTQLELSSSLNTILEYGISYCDSLTTITGNCPVSADKNSLYNNDVLTNVTLPKAKYFEKYAFSYSKNIVNLNVGNATLDSYVFGSNNNAITSVTAGTLKEDALYGLTSLQTVKLTNAGSIGNYALYGCKNIKSVSSNAKSVGDYAFRDCSSLQTVNLPKATKIGTYAFAQDESLATVKFGKVSVIDKYAFSNCAKLKTVSGTSNLKKVMDGAFSMNTNLQSFGSAKKLTYIGDSAFGNCKKLKGSFGFSKVTYVGPMAFANCQSFTSTLNFTKVTEIGTKAFLACKKVKGNTTGTKLTKLGSCTFLGCEKLKSVYVPSSCKSIGYDSFVKKVNSISVSSYGYISASYTSSGAKIAVCGNKGSEAQNHARIYKCKFKIAVKSIKTNKKSFTIKKGKTAKLKISLSPSNASNKGVTLVTSNKKVAKVNGKGVIKGLKKGKCTITIKSKDGSLKTKKVTVKVK